MRDGKTKPRGKKYFKRRINRTKYGKRGDKNLFRSVRPYGVKPDPFPPRLHTRVKYVQTGVVISNAVSSNIAGNERVFRLSSIYDNDFTGLGSTVVGWNVFNTMYEKYIVKGAKVEIIFSDPQQDGQINFCSLNQTASLQNQTTDKIMQDSLTYSSRLNNTGSQKGTMKFFVNPWSLRGLSKLEWMANKSGHSSLLAANPTTDIYLRIATANTNTSSYGSSVNYQIKIILYTEFFDRKQLLVAS